MGLWDGAPADGHQGGFIDVCLWHLADVPLALTNVCFEGKNGHDAGVTPFPLMTQSGLFKREKIRSVSRGRGILEASIEVKS